MLEPDDRPGLRTEPSRWRHRLGKARFVLPVTAVVLALLHVLGELSLAHGMLGFAVITAAALIEARGRPAPEAARARERAPADIIDRVIDAAIAGMPDPVIVLDRDGGVRAFNMHATELAPALARGHLLSFAMRHPNVLDALRRARTAQAELRAEFFERVPADRWWEAVITPVAIEAFGRTFALIVVVFHDRTALRQIEEMRADFVANASHELRTPLAALSGFIDTLRGSARADAQARDRFLGIMKDQADRMARVIDDLLSLSRIELKAHLHPETNVDLVAIVRQVADALQVLAKDRDVTIALDAAVGPVTVLGDRDELIRVFENLIENALKYGASGKRVNIVLACEATGAGGEAVASVCDYGPGIAPEHLPRLTERFYRVDVAGSRAQGGTGLGLALVKHILQRHRGRLLIDSTPGQGATFTIRLPLVAANAPNEK